MTFINFASNRGRGTSSGRSLFVLTLAVLLGAVFAACGSSGSTSKPASGGADDARVTKLPDCNDNSIQSPPSRDVSGTVHTVLEEVGEFDFIKKMIPKFRRAYPNVTIDIQGANYDVIHDAEVASFQKSRGTYDLVQTDTAWVPEFASAGFLEDLGPATACLGQSYDYFDFSPSVREIGQSGGKIWGIPYYSYPTAFIYDSRVWDQVPTTLDELASLAKQHTSGDLAGVALQPKQGQVIIEEWNAYLLAAGGELRNPDTGKWTIDTPEGMKALKTYIDVYNNAAPADSLNWGFDESTRAAASGKATALTTYALYTPILNSIKKSQVGEFQVAPFPGGRGTGGSWMWSIPTNAANKDAAWAWIAWYTARAQDKERTIMGGAPIRDSVMDDPEVWRKGGSKAYYQAYKKISADAVPLCRGVGCAEAMQRIGEHLNAAVAGVETSEEALNAAQHDAEAATG